MPSWSRTMRCAIYFLDAALCSLESCQAEEDLLTSAQKHRAKSIDRRGPVQVSQHFESGAAHGCNHRSDQLMSRRPFRGMHLGPATKNIHRVRNRVKEVNQYGREEEGC